MQDPNDKNQMQKSGIKFNNFFSTLIKDRRPIVRENIQLKTEHLLAKLSDREKQVNKRLIEVENRNIETMQRALEA